MRLPAPIFGFLIIFGLGTMGSAGAALVLQLDPTAFKISFAGSNTGTTNTNSGVGRVDWTGAATLSDSTSQSLAIGSAFDAGSGIAFSPNSFFRRRGGTSDYYLELYTNSADTQTISGNGFEVSYSSWTPLQKADLQSFVVGGGELALLFGGEFSSISTQVVPEPGTVALLGSALVVGGLAAARRRAASRRR